jgi:hypothetical protein
MAMERGLSKGRHARACPGHPRPAIRQERRARKTCKKDLHGRDKPGHEVWPRFTTAEDGLESVKKTHQVARVGKDAIQAGYPPIWTTLCADFG